MKTMWWAKMKMCAVAIALALGALTLMATGEAKAQEGSDQVIPRGSDAWPVFDELKSKGLCIYVLGVRPDRAFIDRPAHYPIDPYTSPANSFGAEWMVIKDTRWHLTIPSEFRFKPVAVKDLVEGVAGFNHFQAAWYQEGKTAILYRGEKDEVLAMIRKELASPEAPPRAQAARRSKWIEDIRVAPLLIKASSDQDPEVRRLAARSLCRLGFEAIARMEGERLLPSLKVALQDSNPWVRAKAASALGLFPSPKSITLLEKASRDKERKVRGAVALALGKIGTEEVLVVLSQLTRDKEPTVRAKSAAALGVTSQVKALPLLEGLIEDKDTEVSKEAIISLGKIGGAPALALLGKLLGHQDKRIRFETVTALAWVGEGAANLLEKALNDPNKWVGLKALVSLGKIGGAKALTLLEKALEHQEEAVRAKAAFSLGLLGGEQAVPLLEKALKSEETSISTAAISALGTIGGAKALALLEKALKHQDEDVRAEAVRALGNVGGGGAVALLEKALKDEEPDVRSSVAISLGKIGGEKAMLLLEKAFQDDDPDVHENVIASLGRIGGEGALPLLDKAIQDQDKAVRVRAVSALGDIGGEKALTLLEKAHEQAVKETKGERYKPSSVGLRCKIAATIARFRGERALSLIEKVILADADRTGVPNNALDALPHVGVHRDLVLSAVKKALVEDIEGEGITRSLIPQKAAYVLFRSHSDEKALPLWEILIFDKAISGGRSRKPISPLTRWKAIFALSQIGGSKATEILQKFLEKERRSSVLRWSTVDALTWIGGEKARDVLIKRLSQEPDENVRQHVADMLRINFSGDPEVAVALKGFLKKSP